jgi:hypothetical protein
MNLIAGFPVFENRFDLVFFLIFDDIWRWSSEASSIGRCFGVWHEKGSMEDVVDFPGFWEFKAVGKWSEDIFNLEGSFPSCPDLFIVPSFDISGI